MKANELMIDDWVYNKNIDKPMQIYPMIFSQMFRSNPNANTEDYNIFPIPLTTEILEKNGFYYDEDRKAYLISVIFQVKPENGGLFSFKICGCPYPLNIVHELQHALRLCGIDKTIEL